MYRNEMEVKRLIRCFFILFAKSPLFQLIRTYTHTHHYSLTSPPCRRRLSDDDYNKNMCLPQGNFTQKCDIYKNPFFSLTWVWFAFPVGQVIFEKNLWTYLLIFAFVFEILQAIHIWFQRRHFLRIFSLCLCV